VEKPEKGNSLFVKIINLQFFSQNIIFVNAAPEPPAIYSAPLNNAI
jgi:hypothetical protein